MNKTEVKIPEMLFFQEGPGVRNTQYTSSGVKLLNVANLVDGKVDLSTSYRYISEDEAYGKYRHFLCDEGDFIVASSGIKVDYIDKKMGFISREMLPLCMNTSTIRFKVLDDSKLNIKYFMYFLKSTAFKKQLAKQITGSAQLNYGPSHLKQMTFPLIDIKIQNDLVQKLDSIMRIIDQKNTSLKKLDELVKARFVEMFGDPSKGDKIKTDKRKIGEIATVTKLAGFEFTKYINYQEEGDIIMLRGLNCKNGHLVLDNIKWIDQAISDALPRSKLYKGDILMTYAGTIGDIAMVDKDNTYHLAPNVGKISINNTNEINPVFLTQLFLNTHDYIMSFASQVAQASINMQKIRDFDYYFPPIDLQNQFATFVTQVDKSKFAVQKSLEKTQLLFDSLMQEYFG